MRDIKFVVYQEGNQFTAQCLNVDVASCGDTIDEAIFNIKEAVELYFEDNGDASFHDVGSVLVGDSPLNV
jgi:predicted RNase H-like HicB family nuclease